MTLVFKVRMSFSDFDSNDSVLFAPDRFSRARLGRSHDRALRYGALFLCGMGLRSVFQRRIFTDTIWASAPVYPEGHGLLPFSHDRQRGGIIRAGAFVTVEA